MVLDPDNEFNVDRTLTKDDVQKLIRVNISSVNAQRGTFIGLSRFHVFPVL